MTERDHHSLYVARLRREAALPANPHPVGTAAHGELEAFKRGELYWQKPDTIADHPW